MDPKSFEKFRECNQAIKECIIDNPKYRNNMDNINEKCNKILKSDIKDINNDINNIKKVDSVDTKWILLNL